MRKPLVAGNWKMNGNAVSINELMGLLVSGVKQAAEGVDVLVCPPAVYLAQVSELARGSAIKVGAQNACQHAAGAYTGEVALPMLAEFDCEYVIIGHSERRALFGEDDALVAEKCAAALAQGITPILCVGESLEQRDAGQALAVVGAQIEAVLTRCGIGAVADMVIAYEPVWAIGTGRTATPAQAQEIHAAIRAQLAEQDAKVAAEVRVLYGGSVTAATAAELFAQPDIDGGLVGGASLKAADFLAICSAAAA
ncbi:triose-phosphate isomerase [Marinobacterium arenosum]|uniref:triose-phosphate isomerase n=1 Tax=Marinobacterium arenosum TaxID=2862496 RepID=UPI001C97584C|nr:triose-phosphate isomerase [Marinobacterium arenosum]MBY4678804.1 triose-phosphate isomerase [Marinobacterium arenosum]